jgi:hypothetical protein
MSQPLLRWSLIVLTCCAGCTTLRPAAGPALAAPAGGVVFVADGSGDLRQVADTLATVAHDNYVPLRVERIAWSHGKGAVFLDLYDADNQQAQGKALAQQVVAYRRQHPEQRICLVGYSSGASIVLAAGEHLPPGAADRLVLLSPTVSAKHDLRPTLRACREGIDTFNSEWDTICLMMYATGTGDGAGQAVAGRTGFVPVGSSPQDAQLYQGLRQHAWQGAANWSGHNGGHFGCFEPAFLRDRVLPPLLGR